VLGALSIGITDSDRRYGPDDVAFAQEVARRAALAIDNARLYGALRVSGTVTGANQAFLTSVGYTKEDIENGHMSWREMTPAGYVDADNAKLEELRKNRFHTPYEKEYVRRDGTLVPVLIASAFFPDSDEEGISYVVDLDDV
jgi:PAS domain S-box-containing protein